MAHGSAAQILPSPVLGVAILASLAWIALALTMAALPSATAGAPPSSSASIWMCMPGMSGQIAGAGGPFSQALAGMPMWSLMALAMMLPAAIPASGHVAVNSLRRRRRRAVWEFILAYLMLWLAFGALALFLIGLMPIKQSAVLLTVGLAIAALWELSPAKRIALNRCHRTSPLPPRGWRASAGTVRFGVVHGSACVASCWPIMLVMLVAPSARLVWCGGLAVVSASEKMARRPRRTVQRVSALLGFAFAAAAIAQVVG